jgi:nucleoside-diphosphate-sugar epimerase
LVTGSSGLIGSEAAAHFDSKGHTVVGVDNPNASCLESAARVRACGIDLCAKFDKIRRES